MVCIWSVFGLYFTYIILQLCWISLPVHAIKISWFHLYGNHGKGFFFPKAKSYSIWGEEEGEWGRYCRLLYIYIVSLTADQINDMVVV